MIEWIIIAVWLVCGLVAGYLMDRDMKYFGLDPLGFLPAFIAAIAGCISLFFVLSVLSIPTPAGNKHLIPEWIKRLRRKK